MSWKYFNVFFILNILLNTTLYLLKRERERFLLNAGCLFLFSILFALAELARCSCVLFLVVVVFVVVIVVVQQSSRVEKKIKNNKISLNSILRLFQQQQHFLFFSFIFFIFIYFVIVVVLRFHIRENVAIHHKNATVAATVPKIENNESWVFSLFFFLILSVYWFDTFIIFVSFILLSFFLFNRMILIKQKSFLNRYDEIKLILKCN